MGRAINRPVTAAGTNRSSSHRVRGDQFRCLLAPSKPMKLVPFYPGANTLSIASGRQHHVSQAEPLAQTSRILRPTPITYSYQIPAQSHRFISWDGARI